MSKLEIYSFGYVAADFKEDDPYLSVTPIEVIPTVNGDPNTKVGSKGSFTNINGGIDNFSAVRSTTISAKWLPWNSANGTPPCLYKGEMVILLRFGGGDNFWWVSASNEIKLRGPEKAVMMCSATPSSGSIGSEYYAILDSINKCIRVHMSNGNGEICGYDIDIDGKTGELVIQDTMGNEIMLNSPAGILDFKINTDINNVSKKSYTIKTSSTEITTGSLSINAGNADTKVEGSVNTISKVSYGIETDDTRIKTNSFSVTNDSGELIAILSELIDTLSNEIHIDSIGGNTKMSGGSKSALEVIKAKIDSFKA